MAKRRKKKISKLSKNPKRTAGQRRSSTPKAKIPQATISVPRPKKPKKEPDIQKQIGREVRDVMNPPEQREIAKNVRAILKEQVNLETEQRLTAKDVKGIIEDELNKRITLRMDELRNEYERLSYEGLIDVPFEKVVPSPPKRLSESYVKSIEKLDLDTVGEYYRKRNLLEQKEDMLRASGKFSLTPESALPKIPKFITQANVNALDKINLERRAEREEYKYEARRLVEDIAKKNNNLDDALKEAEKQAITANRLLVEYAKTLGVEKIPPIPGTGEKPIPVKDDIQDSETAAPKKQRKKSQKAEQDKIKNNITNNLIFNTELQDKINKKLKQIAKEAEREQKEFEKKRKREERERKKKEKEKKKAEKESKASEAIKKLDEIEKTTGIEQPKVEEPETPTQDFVETDSEIIQEAKEEIKKENKESEQKVQEATDNVEEAQKEVNDVIKPKELSDEQIEDITDAFYEESEKEQGDGNPPSEAVEVIMNVVEELGGSDEQAKFNFSDKLYSDILNDEGVSPYYNFNKDETTAGIDYFWNDTGEMKSVLDEALNRLENWEPLPAWSSNLQSIKRRDVSSALRIITSAIEKQGVLQTARNLWEHAAELNEMISEIMYRGSGHDFLQGRDAITNDLRRLREIVIGHMMSFEEAAELSDEMESEEFYDDVME